MKLTEHDQKILDDMEKDFERMTGKKATHVFIDKKETIEPNNYQDRERESWQDRCGK